jgi:hypothetical protein
MRCRSWPIIGVVVELMAELSGGLLTPQSSGTSQRLLRPLEGADLPVGTFTTHRMPVFDRRFGSKPDHQCRGFYSRHDDFTHRPERQAGKLQVRPGEPGVHFRHRGEGFS